jgi:hypothetical protein
MATLALPVELFVTRHPVPPLREPERLHPKITLGGQLCACTVRAPKNPTARLLSASTRPIRNEIVLFRVLMVYSLNWVEPGRNLRPTAASLVHAG